MIKNDVAVIGIGLAGQTVGYDFQQKNYYSLLINGSVQDNRTLPDAKNIMVLEGYDGLAGNRELALEALKKNKHIVKKITEIEQKIILAIASGYGDVMGEYYIDGHKIWIKTDLNENTTTTVFLPEEW